MQIFIAKNNGFCKGVERAVKTANAVCQEGVYIFGDLIHNEKVVAQIESKGAKTVYDINEVPNNSKVVIRSHGVQKSVYELLKNKNCEIIVKDDTAKSWLLARRSDLTNVKTVAELGE